MFGKSKKQKCMECDDVVDTRDESSYQHVIFGMNQPTFGLYHNQCLKIMIHRYRNDKDPRRCELCNKILSNSEDAIVFLDKDLEHLFHLWCEPNILLNEEEEKSLHLARQTNNLRINDDGTLAEKIEGKVIVIRFPPQPAPITTPNRIASLEQTFKKRT